MAPKVSFLVPCYKLAHLLPDCVDSILAQTYEDFEVLIMDDCSPDATPEVARSFGDRRVRHVRNERNLGHIANYNKGIGLARGKYLWLISADDRLRRPYVLERYARIMEAHPGVGFVFCPAVRLEDGRETEVMESTAAGTADAIFRGHDFLRRLLWYDIVSAPAAMSRMECYEKVSLFPPDLPYSGDWYLWCAFALHYDVAYFAEPMVNRRFHPDNISKFFLNQAKDVFAGNCIEPPWRIKERAVAAGFRSVARTCTDAIAFWYVWALTDSKVGITPEEFEESLRRHAPNRREEAEIRAAVYAGLGDEYYWRRDFQRALQWYGSAVGQRRFALGPWAKYLLLRMGDAGVRFRERVSAVRRQTRTLTSDQS